MRQKIAKNTFFLTTSQLIARAIGFIYFVILARKLGVENFGIYTFTLAFVYNFVSVADFGLERLVIRDIARRPEKTNEYFSQLFSLRLFLFLISYIVLLGLGLILGQSIEQIMLLAIFGLFLLPNSLIYLISNFQVAVERMIPISLANIATSIIPASIGIVFVLSKMTLNWILLAPFLGYLLVLFFFFSQLKSWGLKIFLKIDWKFWKKALRQSWVFAALTIIAVFYLRTSIVLLGIIKGDYQVGLYGSAFKFVEAGILLPQSLALALFPLSSRLFEKGKEQLKIIYKKGMGFLFLGGLLVFLVMCFGSKLIIPFVYGSSYQPAVPVFSVLGLAMFFFFLNSLSGNIGQNSPKVKTFLLLLGTKFVFHLILCLLLIPRWSILGAAWAVVLSEMFGTIINNFFVWRILR